jgi:hypothetical protein
MELASRWAKRLAAKKTNLPPERIGCIFISPCPAKATSIKRFWERRRVPSTPSSPLPRSIRNC